MAALELLAGEPFGEHSVSRDIPLAAGQTTCVGRELLGINDKRLSRKQLDVQVGASVTVTRVGANASFVQRAADDVPTELHERACGIGGKGAVSAAGGALIGGGGARRREPSCEAGCGQLEGQWVAIGQAPPAEDELEPLREVRVHDV